MGIFYFFRHGVLERGREGLDTDFGGEAEVGDGRQGSGGGGADIDSLEMSPET